MVPRWHEQRLGSREATANSGARATGLDAPAHRRGHRHTSRNGQRLSASRRRGRPISGWPAEGVAAKTGHHAGGVHRLRTVKTGHHRDGVHRPWATLSTWARAECECLRAVPGGDHRGPGPWPQRHGHLARPRRRSRIHRTLRQCPTVRADAARRHAGRGARGDHHLPRGGRPNRLRRGPDGARPADREVPPRAPVRVHPGLLAQVSAVADVAIEYADLGGAARTRVSSDRRHGQGHRARQPWRGRPHPGYLRSGAQSALSRRSRPLRRRRPSVPRERSRSQRESRGGRRPREEDAVEGPALRDARGGAGVLGPLGDALGRYAHPRHDEAPGRRHVCRGTAGARPATPRTVSLLPVRRPHGASQRLRRSRGRVLWRAARVARATRPGAVECTARAADRAPDRPAPAGASAHAPRLVPDPRRGPARAHAALDVGAPRTRDIGRPPHRRPVHADPAARRRPGHPPHPGRPRAREETRGGGGRGGRQSGARDRRADLSLPAEVRRPSPAGAADLTPGRSAHSATHALSRSDRSQNRRRTMNLVELDHALRKLRLSGMAAVLETRLRQAQTDKLTPIDLVSTLVSDELLRRQDRLLERRHSQARFRDPDRSLDSFDFEFNKKMNRALIHELATARFIAQREDALFLGPPGTGKSHLAQAIGRAVIQQGYRVVYREAHMLLEEIADATLDGTRKTYFADLAAVPLLIVDDLGMRKLPHTAAEDLLEVIMRRYERASTLPTSNRPVNDWGKLLGDTAAVTALLDRLLHHAHILKCGPRSWRTKLQVEP